MAPQVTMDEADAPDGLGLREAQDVTLYPEQVSGPRGVYPAEAVNLADSLQSRGIVALPWHDLDHCDWSTAHPTISAFRLGVASTAGWSAVQDAMRQRVNPVRLTVGWWAGENERWVTLEGEAPAVADALEALR